LKQREQELLKRAERNVEERHKVPWWKKATRVLGAICSLCPVGQPVTGVIGGGLGLISDIDELTPWEMVEGIGSISKTDYKQYGMDCEDLGDVIKDLPDDLSNLTLVAGYVGNVCTKSEPIGKEAKKYKDILKETEIPQDEVKAEFLKIRATDPEFNDLFDEIAELMARKEALGKQLAKSIQMTFTLSNAITFDLLAIDGMNRDIADGNAVLDHRASAYLKEMEHRETERLLKYHYYMAKGYEYRLLEPYPGELNLDSLFNKFKNIAEAADSDHNLGSDDFNALKALYEEQLSTIAEGIYYTYQSNPPELSAPIRFNISQEEIQKLNTGEPVTINLMDMGMFPLSDENVRIVKLNVKTLDVHPESEDLGEWAYMDIHMEHSGLSKLVQDGEVYQFRHYNPFTENPITWRARYDPFDHSIYSIEPSAASGSLLRSLILLPDGEILIYSRPAAWADITLTKDVNTQTGIDMVIDSLRLEVIYDFTPKDSNKVKLQVLVSEDGLLPYFIVDAKDLNNRQDGRGNFHRTYYKNPNGKVTVKAPASYGVWQFEKWTDRYGNDLDDDPTNRILELNLDADQVIRAQMYTQPIASFTYSPEYPIVNENITFNASSSYDFNGFIEKYEWYFGNGINTTGEVVTYSYSKTGDYIVTLTVTDDYGHTCATNKTLRVVSSSAESISIGSATTPPNSTITIPISVANVTNISGISFYMLYNSSVVAVSSVSANESFVGSSITLNIDNPNGNTNIVLTNSNLISAPAETPVIDIAFNITGGSGSSTSLDLQNVEFSDVLLNPYTPAVVVDGQITVGIKGDFSGDGITDAWDITYLARSIAGIPGYETLYSDDISGDGVVDIWDCTYLARAIAGVPGYTL
jgi:hypothetical protein